jgi:hypothetical protein
MRRFGVSVVAVLLLVSCKYDSKFVVSGVVEDGKGQTLYLEQVGLSKSVVLDSANLSSDGEFSFKEERSEFTPEFYQLRLKDQVINLAIDSTESISVKASAKDFATGYSVEGSRNCSQIKSLNTLSMKTKASIDSLVKLSDKKIIGPDLFTLQTREKLSMYKREALKVIYSDPKSAAAYFALFQRIYSYLIFSPSTKEDIRAFGAVATSYDLYYPNNPRTKHLKEFTLQAMGAMRRTEGLRISRDKVNMEANFDIELPDLHGDVQKLSSLTGKVVVLCFTAYQAKFSPELNMTLGEMYSADRSRGLEIYQVSLDEDENFWKVSASHLPWKCVRDIDGVDSSVAQRFNVKQLPTVFLLNRDGEIVKRVQNLQILRSEIDKLL